MASYKKNYRKYTNIDNFNAIIFHERNLEIRDVPSRRKFQQFYIHFNLESPAYQSDGEELCLCGVQKRCLRHLVTYPVPSRAE